MIMKSLEQEKYFMRKETQLMSNILCLGGAGFIGSHLVRKLLDRGDTVTVIDNMSVGKASNLPNHKNLRVQVADILDNIGSYYKGVDVVFHLAAQTRPQASILEPIETNIVNVNGTLKTLLHCRDNRVKRIVFTSTTGIYGDQEQLPTPETALPNPMSPYALSKLIGEQYCQLFETMYRQEFNICRPFNVYGERQSPSVGYAAAIPKFIDALSKGETPFITGDGTQSRDFIYVGDVVDQLLLMATSEIHSETFNAGSGESTSINDIYRIISGIMGKNVKPDYVDPVFEPKQTLGAIDKAEYLLGWKPKYSLEEGLALTIKNTNANSN
jgi:UDP-glucose 4-epimerase